MERPLRLLVADDEEAMRLFLSAALERAGHRVDAVEDGQSALEKIVAAERSKAPYALALIDLQMPRLPGMDLLSHIRREWPRLPVIILTAHGSIPTAVEAMKLGAADFLVKPLPSPGHLRAAVSRVLAQSALNAAAGHNDADRDAVRSDTDPVGIAMTPLGPPTAPAASPSGKVSAQRESGRLSTPAGGVEALRRPNPELAVNDLIACDPATCAVLEQARLVAETDTTVLLLGESGVGKEVFAGVIHRLSKRSAGPFVAVNCAALPTSLIESELFGHERGAFTGAHTMKIGRFEQATGGTLFLDEIGELEATVQAKLLRVLQEKRFERIGGTRSIAADCRIIAATNRDLKAAVQERQFRSDLYYRLAVFPIEIPPLCRRPADILPLATHFLTRFAGKNGRDLPQLTEAALAALQEHPWPGNVRELANAIERALILCAGGPIEPRHLGLAHREKARADQGVKALADSTDDGILKQQERDTILRVLAANGNNRQKTAQQLGISVRTLRNKLKEYRIQTD
ncbi:sigma-54 dependent response regulator [Heliomicrobium modesticaldum Ice1]|uniref:Stage 0 sporulation protein A homolog n=1 Tax=Heliobacterium modesticaldum (strain ATCC 51547 / Ice1) TaxID=498761 RepID=B0TGM7_HELMI|nr:sigma-54 dependent transcriptional regulator [Heliomicrobium modesticaldum]ABZ83288.1 sigma-54 dependent response regulator [Heliomicrobium modesticaldum Ice1]